MESYTDGVRQSKLHELTKESSIEVSNMVKGRNRLRIRNHTKVHTSGINDKVLENYIHSMTNPVMKVNSGTTCQMVWARTYLPTSSNMKVSLKLARCMDMVFSPGPTAINMRENS